ncbi:hypothetical protein SEMRO_370_G128390.1 [Seminavis robusta]|uniref:Uncharacterized protein n=1 Tax=Seminavis robusta TaxID=568900 RepID=A0A9N8DXK4_9STRA|nr:hypothetical protein SEMRO_370_G128390.1 [Seminavis robusta]|eukprot:Sro370_g128390.1 n/a (200) ;mRNA; f:16276-16875
MDFQDCRLWGRAVVAFGLNQVGGQNYHQNLGLNLNSAPTTAVNSSEDTSLPHKFDIMIFRWNRLAATSGNLTGEVATLGSVSLELKGHSVCNPTIGPVVLERFANTPLFRIAVLDPTSTHIVGTVTLPADSLWTLYKPMKVKSTNAGLKAIKIIITVDSIKEGYDMVKVTLPYDGEQGSAVLFGQALIFASSTVTEANM